MDALRPLIPIKFDKVRIAVRVSGEDYGRCYEDFKHFGKVTKEEWQKDGSWIGVIEMPAGPQNEFHERSQQDPRRGRDEGPEGRAVT